MVAQGPLQVVQQIAAPDQCRTGGLPFQTHKPPPVVFMPVLREDTEDTGYRSMVFGVGVRRFFDGGSGGLPCGCGGPAAGKPSGPAGGCSAGRPWFAGRCGPSRWRSGSAAGDPRWGRGPSVGTVRGPPRQVDGPRSGGRPGRPVPARSGRFRSLPSGGGRFAQKVRLQESM
ncbi:hypothetical protein GCM10023079_00780 [Streptomyces chitinivorans]